METGRIDAIRTGPGNSVQYLTFTFNTLGNLSQRVDAVAGLTDTLAYDGLNRLTQVVTSNPGLPLSLTKTVAYDSIGNITSKSDVGDYTYDPARIHAVAGIVPGATGTVTASYTYDGNGNLLTGNGRTVTWTSFDMVDEVTQGANSLTFTYDSERNRLKQVSSDGSVKYYLNDPISGIMAEKIVGASLSVTWNDYIMVGAEMVALKVSGAATQTRYFHKDHLGSITALTNEAGAVAELNSFDAWGQRRNPMGPDDPLFPGLSLTSQITRGYTGHEQLDQVGLVHMNGRIYDPIIGKMMSADPTVPNPIDGQSYNRYSYVGNNPLSLTDPTGFYDVDPDHPGRMGNRDDADSHASRGGDHVGDSGAKSGGGDVTQGGASDANLDGSGIAPEEPGDVQYATKVPRAILDLLGVGSGNKPGPRGGSGGHIIGGVPKPKNQGDIKQPDELPPGIGKPSGPSKIAKEGRYEFPDKLNEDRMYVGQSRNMQKRLERHIKDGRLQPGTETTTEVSGGRLAREIQEHNRIQELTGGQKASTSPAVSNKVDPIGPARRPGLGLPEPFE